jgi:hypothetical protein
MRFRVKIDGKNENNNMITNKIYKNISSRIVQRTINTLKNECITYVIKLAKDNP